MWWRWRRGESHSLAVKGDGTVWAWGDNTYAQLGDGTTTWQIIPVQVPSLTGVGALAGGFHSLAGQGRRGQSGRGVITTMASWAMGTTTWELTPVQIPGLSALVMVKGDGKRRRPRGHE